MKVQPEPKPAIQKAPKVEALEEDSAEPNDDSQELQEIPIAGRTKMTVPKNKDNNAPTILLNLSNSYRLEEIWRQAVLVALYKVER